MAKVVPLASVKAFLEGLEKSGLLPASDVAALRSSRGDDSDPKLVARDLVRENKITKWQAGQLLHGFHQLVMGKYKLMDQLGSGEMGRVYLAEHAQLARKVSLKILSRKYTADPDTLKKVLEDGRKASALNHRNLTHVFDVDSADERYYIVTEYVEGKDLRQLVEAGGATAPDQAMDIIRQAAEGLQHAHDTGMCHGDLKPSNLTIDSSGGVKVLDLGLARLTQAPAALVGEESTEVATLAAQAFHAPEQATKHEVTPLVDVYALGGILFYLLSGKPPANVKSAQDVKAACPAASSELAELCAKMLAESPADRPQSAEQVIAGLEKCARAKAKAAPKESKPSDGEKQAAKQKKPLIAKPLEIPLPAQTAAPVATGDAVAGENPEVVIPFAKAESPPESPSDDPFAGFSLQTKKRKVKSEAAAPQVTAAPSVAAPPSESAPTPAKSASKPSMAIVLGVGIGGGVLILGIGVAALIWALSRGGQPVVDKNAIAKADVKQADAGGTDEPSTESNPESNPETNPEVNPTVPAAEATPEKTTPAASGEGPKATVPMPMPTPPMPMPTPPMATPMPMPPAVTPMPPAATPMPKAETPKPVTPAPMPEPAVPVGNPFMGFAKNATLPPLEEKGKAVADATKPVSLGTVKLPPKLLCSMKLHGGENAISTNTKQKFVLEAGNNGTSERDWDIKIATEGASATTNVAKLAIEGDQLNFQWTEEATKQLASAPYLCNCVLNMSAGAGSHQLILRQPLTAEPMKVDLEKPMLAKFTIDYPPNPKQIVIQLGPPAGKFPKFKFEKPELTAKSDNTVFMTGPGDDLFLLHFRLASSMTGKQLKIDALPQFKLHLMNKPEKYLKARMAKLVPELEAAAQIAIQQQNQIASNLNAIPAERRAQIEAESKKRVEDTATQKTQAVMLGDLVKDLQGDAKLHFQILFEADSDTKYVLVSTGGPPPVNPQP